jgi:hypothetical protein
MAAPSSADFSVGAGAEAAGAAGEVGPPSGEGFRAQPAKRTTAMSSRASTGGQRTFFMVVLLLSLLCRIAHGAVTVSPQSVDIGFQGREILLVEDVAIGWQPEDRPPLRRHSAAHFVIFFLRTLVQVPGSRNF